LELYFSERFAACCCQQGGDPDTSAFLLTRGAAFRVAYQSDADTVTVWTVSKGNRAKEMTVKGNAEQIAAQMVKRGFTYQALYQQSIGWDFFRDN